MHDIEVIPRSVKVYSATWANRPVTDLVTGDLFNCTDRKTLYRWNGTSFDAVTIYSGSGLYANKPAAADLPDASLYYATDQALTYQTQGGAWVQITQAPALNVVDTQVYSNTKNATFADLDLSSVVGTNYALVLLRVTGAATSNQVVFRCNGDTLLSQAYASTQANTVGADASGLHGYAWVKTDSGGIVEWATNCTGTITVSVIAYVK